MMQHGKIWLWVLTPLLACGAASPTVPGPTAPPLPAISGLELRPSKLALKNLRDERRVLVLGRTDGTNFVDLTAHASFKTSGDAVEVSGPYLRARSKGSAEVTISAAGHTAALPVIVESADVPEVRFVRDVEPLLGKFGCNAGTCHGSAKGKNGFKLSLRGYDPEFDYQSLINDISGRRFNRTHPEESLMLLKPTAEVPHEGRQLFKTGSREYQLLRDWIAQGARHEDIAAARAVSIEILPGDVEMDLPGRDQQMLVIAKYPDGTTRDVTRDAHFSVSNTEVAEVDG